MLIDVARFQNINPSLNFATNLKSFCDCDFKGNFPVKKKQALPPEINHAT